MAVGALFLDYRSVSADCRRRLRFLETTLESGEVAIAVLALAECLLVKPYPIQLEISGPHE